VRLNFSAPTKSRLKRQRWIRCGFLWVLSLINAGSGGHGSVYRIVLAHCFGTREHKYLDELRSLLAPFKLNIVYCDDTFVYKARLFDCVVKTLSVIRSVLSVSICFCVLGVAGLFEGVLFF